MDFLTDCSVHLSKRQIAKDIVHLTFVVRAGKQSVAKLSAHELSPTFANQEQLEHLDRYSASEFLLHYLPTSLGDSDNLNRLIFIEELRVEEKYQRRGAGTYALNCFLDQIGPGRDIALEACPHIDGSVYELISNVETRVTTIKKDTERLKGWYLKFGFKALAGDFMLLPRSRYS